MFPSVPHHRAGIRVTLTNHLELPDIDGFVAACAEIIPEAFYDHGMTVQEVRERFANARVGPVAARHRRQEKDRRAEYTAVSYKHLTLPTIQLV